MTDKAIEQQRAEFEAVERLIQAANALPPIVDDDYPEMRSRYEGAMYSLLRAARENGRFERILPLGELREQPRPAERIEDYIRRLIHGPRQLFLTGIMDINVQRCNRWHEGGVDDWTPERWITAIVGELGEMANIRKKLFRIADGMVGSTESIEELTEKEADEWADTMLYLLLFAAARRIDPNEALIRVFNRKSQQLGFPEML